MNSCMVYGSQSTAEYSVPGFGQTLSRHIIDLHYFYKDKKIVVEQDENEHAGGGMRYSVENELKGLVGREQFADLPGLIIIIRNNGNALDRISSCDEILRLCTVFTHPCTRALVCSRKVVM